MSIIIKSVNGKQQDTPEVGMDDLHLYMALVASQSVFNCESLDDAYEKLQRLVGDKLIVYQGGHHVALLKRQPGTHEGIPLVQLVSTADKDLYRWEALQELITSLKL